MIAADRILIELMVTEKSTLLQSTSNKYTFKVHPDTNRRAVADAIEQTFDGVKVDRVNIINVKPKAKPDRTRRGRVGFKSAYKKAIVSLKEGAIEIV